MIQDVCTMPPACEAQPARGEEADAGLFAGLLAGQMESGEKKADAPAGVTAETVAGDGVAVVPEDCTLPLELLPVVEMPEAEPEADVPQEAVEETDDEPEPEAVAPVVPNMLADTAQVAAGTEAEEKLSLLSPGEKEAAVLAKAIPVGEEETVTEKDGPDTGFDSKETDFKVPVKEAPVARAQESETGENHSREEKEMTEPEVVELKRQDLQVKPEAKPDTAKESETALPADRVDGTKTAVLQQEFPRESDLKADLAERLAPQILDKVTERLQMQVIKREETSEIRVMLKPEELGEVVIRLLDEDGRVSGRILVENTMVKDLVERLLPQLKERLERLNINLQEMQVDLGANRDREQRGTHTAARAEYFGWRGPVQRSMAAAATYGIKTSGRLDIMA